MPARTEKPDHRWRFNHNGQLVDSEATAQGWDLADDLVRLKIADASGNAEDLGPIHTPPKSKLGPGPLGSDSPLDAASNPSADSSPSSSDNQIEISHSRGSSIDSASSGVGKGQLNGAHANGAPNKPAASPEGKERPRSYNGNGQGAQWAPSHAAEQLPYPTLAQHHVHRPHPQPPHGVYNNRNPQPSEGDEAQEYNHPRNYTGPVHHPSYLPPANGVQPMGYRQGTRGFQQVLPGASPIPYHGHTSHLSLGSSQQLYDMMLPGAMHDNHHPAVNRVQQQHGVFRATHHHSASDPSSLRDAATIALLNGGMPFAPGMFPHPGMIYGNQYYGGQDVAAAQLMAARIQVPYPGPYTGPAAQPPAPEPANPISPSSTGTGNGNTTTSGPSANNRKLGLYKTELCRSWEEKGSCRYGAKCQFAHGEDEIRRVSRHPKYKTEICRTFWVSGSCPYGKRCCFIHTEVPSSGATPPGGAPSTTESNSSQPDGRARSMSTNSDPNDTSTSILARIKNSANGSPNSNASGGVSTPVESSSNFPQFTRPPTGSLRVDTSVLDGSSIKQQNKSAYPTFASNGMMLPTVEAPVPVTAGPDLGRYNAARREIVGFNGPQQGPKPGHGTRSNPRHSFSGEIDLGFNSSPPASGGSYGLASPGGDNTTTPTTSSSSGSRANGHVRGGSAGNWGTLVRSNLANSSFPNTAGEIISNSPWNDIAVGPTRQWA